MLGAPMVLPQCLFDCPRLHVEARIVSCFGLVVFPMAYKAPMTHPGLLGEKLEEELCCKADPSLLKPPSVFSKGCF